MTHEAYSTKRVTVWEAERDGVAGMAIRYADGYQSWCPKHVYLRDYQAIGKMSFGHAIHALEAGHKVARSGWNGKSMYLELQVPDAHSKMSLPYIFMFTACKNRVPWLASQTDMLAKDWGIVEVCDRATAEDLFGAATPEMIAADTRLIQ